MSYTPSAIGFFETEPPGLRRPDSSIVYPDPGRRDDSALRDPFTAIL